MTFITRPGLARRSLHALSYAVTVGAASIASASLPEPSSTSSAGVNSVSNDWAPIAAVNRNGHHEIAASSLGAGDECEPAWEAAFGGLPGVAHGQINALAVFDDGLGDGPAVYAGGFFSIAGGEVVNHIAKWDGTSWSPLGSGMNDRVHALAVFDDGSGGGPALYVGGEFTTAGGVSASRIAKWDGASWSAVGTGVNCCSVRALTVFDDGSGGGQVLYAGGYFTSAGGVNANRIAKWDGSTWSPLSTGVSGIAQSSVLSLTVFDDGSGGGPALYAGGHFKTAGGVAADFIAKWDGSSWSPLGAGMNWTVLALTVFDDGTGEGPSLYAGGHFTNAGGVSANRMAKWNGSSWSPLASGVSNVVLALTVFDDGTGGGPALYAGGAFGTAGGVTVNRIAKWDGLSWSPLTSGTDSTVRSLAMFDGGLDGNAALFAGGSFATAGGITVDGIANWDGSSWSPLGIGLNSVVRALAVCDDGFGAGPVLYAGGDFITAGGVGANYIAQWDGSSWSDLGEGMSSAVYALATYDDGFGGGPALYASGTFTAAGGVSANRIAKWDGASWSPLGAGLNKPASALAVFDDGLGGGPALYVGGSFTTAGGVVANSIAKWDGTSWSPLGAGTNGWISALTVFDDGSGPALYAGGNFTTAGGVSSRHIAKWDGTSWSPLGTDMEWSVRALAVFDDGLGGGPALYAGGQFTTADGVTVNGIAKWDGSSWSPLGSGVTSQQLVYALSVYDDGSGGGPALYAGGTFSTAGGKDANRIAKWDGSVWSPLGAGMNDHVFALVVYSDRLSGGPALYAGGHFSVSPSGDSYIAKWQGCPIHPECAVADLNCDGVVDVSDLLILLANWGPCPRNEGCVADLNGDSTVDVSDLLILLANWG